MRIGDVIAGLVPDGAVVLDETDPELGLVELLEPLEGVRVVRESESGAQVVVREFARGTRVGEGEDDDGLATLEEALQPVDGARIALIVADVESTLQLGLFGLLADRELEIEQATAVSAPGFTCCMVLGPSSGGDGPTLRARNELRVVWMISRAQSVRLRQLRGQVRAAEKQQAKLSSDLAELGVRLAEAERSRAAFRREARSERERANRAESRYRAATEQLESAQRQLSQLRTIARKARGSVSFRLARATKKAADQLGRNPLSVVDAWRKGFSGPDEILAQVERTPSPRRKGRSRS